MEREVEQEWGCEPRDESGREGESERERKRDSLLIRTRHSLGIVVADHRRHRQRVLTRDCWQAQAHAKALGCRIRS